MKTLPSRLCISNFGVESRIPPLSQVITNSSLPVNTLFTALRNILIPLCLGSEICILGVLDIFCYCKAWLSHIVDKSFTNCICNQIFHCWVHLRATLNNREKKKKKKDLRSNPLAFGVCSPGDEQGLFVHRAILRLSHENACFLLLCVLLNRKILSPSPSMTVPNVSACIRCFCISVTRILKRNNSRKGRSPSAHSSEGSVHEYWLHRLGQDIVAVGTCDRGQLFISWQAGGRESERATGSKQGYNVPKNPALCATSSSWVPPPEFPESRKTAPAERDHVLKASAVGPFWFPS